MTGLSARVTVERAYFAVEVALEVAEGETIAVMGPSGAGKSTLLAALAGLEPLSAGEVRVGDRVVERVAGPGVVGGARKRVPPMRRGVVLLGQRANLFPHLTVRENVAFGPRAGAMPRARARAEADDLLARVGLPGSGGRRPGELSGGEQQRVAVARALAAAPRAVLLDEPLVALDPDTASGIRSMLRDQLRDTTVVAVTHDAVDAVALAERLLVIEAGRVTQAGAVREVLSEPASAFVASIAGLNRVEGFARGGAWEREGVRIPAADAASASAVSAEGSAVAAVFRPGDVRVGAVSQACEGLEEPCATWRATVEHIEQIPSGVRVRAGWCDVDVPLIGAPWPDVGEAVQLSIPVSRVRLLPA